MHKVFISIKVFWTLWCQTVTINTNQWQINETVRRQKRDRTVKMFVLLSFNSLTSSQQTFLNRWIQEQYWIIQILKLYWQYFQSIEVSWFQHEELFVLRHLERWTQIFHCSNRSLVLLQVSDSVFSRHCRHHSQEPCWVHLCHVITSVVSWSFTNKDWLIQYYI